MKMMGNLNGGASIRWLIIHFLKTLIILPHDLSNSVNGMQIFCGFYWKRLKIFLNKFISKTYYIHRFLWSDALFWRPNSQSKLWLNTNIIIKRLLWILKIKIKIMSIFILSKTKTRSFQVKQLKIPKKWGGGVPNNLNWCRQSARSQHWINIDPEWIEDKFIKRGPGFSKCYT